MNPVDLVKKYPVPVIGGAVVVIGIIWLLGSGGGGTQVVAGPSPAQVNANAALQGAQVEAGFQIQQAQIAAGLRADEIAAGSEIELARIDAGLEEARIVQEGTYNANLLAADVRRDELETAELVSTMEYRSQAEQRALEKDIAYQSHIGLLTQINAYQDVEKHKATLAASALNTSFLTQQHIASVNAQTQQAAIRESANVSRYGQYYDYKAQRSQAQYGFYGNVVNGITQFAGGLFNRG